MRLPIPFRALLLALAAASSGACASSPPASAPRTAAALPPERPDLGLTNVDKGSSDSIEAIPGSSDAIYRYRFLQTFPGSERFTFQDRDLSFYFRPTPTALHVQIENRQDRPVWIEWERSTFFDPRGNTSKVAHSSTRWPQRFSPQAPWQIVGLQRYSDYLLPLDYLLDPAGKDEQLHRPLLPEDTTAPQYADKEFGVDLVFRIEERPRTYSFRFRVASVIAR